MQAQWQCVGSALIETPSLFTRLGLGHLFFPGVWGSSSFVKKTPLTKLRNSRSVTPQFSRHLDVTPRPDFFAPDSLRNFSLASFPERTSGIRIRRSLRGWEADAVRIHSFPFLPLCVSEAPTWPSARSSLWHSLKKYLPPIFISAQFGEISNYPFQTMCSTSLNLIWMNVFDKSSSKILLFFSGQFWSPFWNAVTEWSWRAMTPPLGRWNKNDSGDSQDICVLQLISNLS